MGRLAGLRPGFTDPVRQSQTVFRAAMNAMARPAVAVPLEIGIDSPPPLGASAAALLLALADLDTEVWLDAALAGSGEVAEFITFHTGARIVTSCREAVLAVVSAPLSMPPLSSFAQGTPEYTDRSTTVIVQVDRLASEGLKLSGPGIRNTIGFSATPLPRDFHAQIARNRERYPCGVDIIFTTPERIAALPRSVRIAVET